MGGAVYEYLSKVSIQKLTLVIRTPMQGLVLSTIIDQIDGFMYWAQALLDCDVVTRVAARVHIMHDPSLDPRILRDKLRKEGASFDVH